MRKIVSLFLAVLVFSLAACSGGTLEFSGAELASQGANGLGEQSVAAVDVTQEPEVTFDPISVEYDSDDLDSNVNNSGAITITLEGNSITVDGSGATVDGSTVTIASAGRYSISGTLNDGQIIVDTQEEEAVVLALAGVDITCSTSAPIYVRNAEKTVITLADGTENYVTDGAAFIFEDAASDEPDAAIFSHDDLTINGNGSLTVNANYNNGIASQDELKITGGRITVNAVNDGIKGRDSIAVKDGTITINAGGDGLQSNNDEDVDKGYIAIEGGVLNVTSGLDGIQAETGLLVSGGDITITSGGGSADTGASSAGGWGGRGMEGNPNKPTESAKGLKAGVDITITAGAIDINSADDAIHSNNRITINGGNVLLASGDDGVHADSTVTINGGELNITRSYEGIESAVITINDGAIHLVASDDGINATSGNAGGAVNARAMPGNLESGDNNLYVNGGYIAIDAMGDGLDINGTVDMTAGVVIVNGPTNNGNGPLDYLGAFNISGGFLVAAGSSGMAQAPSTSSTQYSVMHTFSSPQAAGTMVHIETQDGEEILTFVPTKAYQSIVLSSPELKNGSTYVVYSGGSATGAATDGLVSDGTYTPGAQVASLTISSMVTGAGSFGGGFPGRPGGGRRQP